jgi:hypothetical protein
MCMCGGCESCERAQGYEPDDDPYPGEDPTERYEVERRDRADEPTPTPIGV